MESGVCDSCLFPLHSKHIRCRTKGPNVHYAPNCANDRCATVCLEPCAPSSRIHIVAHAPPRARRPHAQLVLLNFGQCRRALRPLHSTQRWCLGFVCGWKPGSVCGWKPGHSRGIAWKSQRGSMPVRRFAAQVYDELLPTDCRSPPA